MFVRQLLPLGFTMSFLHQLVDVIEEVAVEHMLPLDCQLSSLETGQRHEALPDPLYKTSLEQRYVEEYNVKSCVE